MMHSCEESILSELKGKGLRMKNNENCVGPSGSFQSFSFGNLNSNNFLSAVKENIITLMYND
jgi:hypothetical protein